MLGRAASGRVALAWHIVPCYIGADEGALLACVMVAAALRDHLLQTLPPSSLPCHPLPCLAATPRLGPKLTEQMPDLNSAAAGWVQARMLPADAAEAAPQQAGPSNAAAAAAAAAAAPTAPPAPAVAPELLPLPHMRLEGKLFTDNQDLVPAAVEPAQPLHWPLKLGTIVLPLATLNEERLKAAAVRWGWAVSTVELAWGVGVALHCLAVVLGCRAWHMAAEVHCRVASTRCMASWSPLQGKQHWSALEWSGKSKVRLHLANCRMLWLGLQLC